MRSVIKFFKILLGLILFSLINPTFILNAYAQASLKVELKKELEKGNFLIGLRQYLGGENDTFSKNRNLNFETDNAFLELHSSNGIKHKSQKININWKDVLIKSPDRLKKFVFGPYSSFESAQKKANSLREKGLNATVVYPKDWEVWIPFENHLVNQLSNYELSKKVVESKITPFLSNENTSIKLEGPIYISSNKDITINNVKFGKQFYIAKDSYGTWTLIQLIKFDDYLKGVLPHEIGPNSPLEALKAQAVIARTWGIYNSGRFSMDQYHLCVTTQCQVYKKPKSENKNVKKAIAETSNSVITYRNKPINAFYHGSNGGIAAGASESWKIQDTPYLKSKIDGSKSLKKSLKLPFSNESQLKKFLTFEEDRLYGKNHSLFRWKKTISNSDIVDNLVKKKIIYKKVNVVDLNIVERGSSGRVTKLEIHTNNFQKPIVLLKDDIRRILSFLPSNLFIINKLNNNLWLFTGGGFGHGVGLSQSGAIEMAKLGFSYEQILDHYYRDAKLKKIEKLSQ